jgi:hypothetical protein
MPLLNQNTRISSKLVELITDTASHVTMASNYCSAMVDVLLSLDDASATAWLNSLSFQEVSDLFTSHFIVGSALNGAIQAIAAQLASIGLVYDAKFVDVRSVADKLADQGREMVYDENGFTVRTIPEPVVVEEEPIIGDSPIVEEPIIETPLEP